MQRTRNGEWRIQHETEIKDVAKAASSDPLCRPPQAQKDYGEPDSELVLQVQIEATILRKHKKY